MSRAYTAVSRRLSVLLCILALVLLPYVAALFAAIEPASPPVDLTTEFLLVPGLFPITIAAQSLLIIVSACLVLMRRSMVGTPAPERPK